MPFLNDSGKEEIAGFPIGQTDSQETKNTRDPQMAGGLSGMAASVSTPFVRHNVKQKQSIAELAALAGKDKTDRRGGPEAAQARKFQPRATT
eukprot:UN08934